MKGVRGDRWCHLIAVYVQAENKQQKILLHQYDIHQRKITEIALAREVLTDALTGLLNRRGLSQKLAEFEAESNGFLLYYIDLDAFGERVELL